MKNAMPITPVASRRLTTTTDMSTFNRRRSVEQSRMNAAVDEATQMMETLDLSSTRLRKPQTAVGKLVTGQSTETKAAATTTTTGLEPIQRRTAWRRSLHFTTATSSPPPPPPRKNFATLPKTIQTVGNNNNNNTNNNNNIHHNPSSKLPVPAFKRNLGSNF